VAVCQVHWLVMPEPAVLESKGHPSPQECTRKRAVRHGVTGGEGGANSPAAAASRKGGRPAASASRLRRPSAGPVMRSAVLQIQPTALQLAITVQVFSRQPLAPTQKQA
jgi:hypothetical protein